MPGNSSPQGKPFENGIDSARNYMLEQLKEKYGQEFQIVGDEELTDYPAHGAVYDCYAAPTDDSDKVFSALVDQSKPNQVRDNFAMYFFKEEAEADAIAFCEGKEYVTAYRIELVTSATEKAWSSQDDFNQFLSETNAHVDLYACVTDGKTDSEYAEMVADFAEYIYGSSIDTSLSVVNNEKYIIFKDFLVLGDSKTPHLTTDEILTAIDDAKTIRFTKQKDLVVKPF